MELPSNLASLKVAQLRQHLADRGLDDKGKKAVLVARLADAVASEIASPSASQEPPTEDTEAAPPAAGAPAEPATEAAAETEPATEAVAEPAAEPAAEPEPETAAPNDTPAQLPATVDDDAAVATTEMTVDEPTEELDYGDETETPRKKRRADSESPKVTDTATGAAADEEPPPSKRSKVDAPQNEADDKVDEDEASGEQAAPWVHVTNLRRPFTLPMLKAMLEQHGAIAADEGSFVTDKYRTFCYVQYASTAETESAANQLDGVTWPEGGNVLTAKVVKENGLKEKADEQRRAAQRRALAKEAGGRVGARGPKKRRSGGQEASARRVVVTQEQKRKPGSAAAAAAAAAAAPKPKATTKSPARPPSQGSKQAVNTLEQLFKKTKALPAIYWLPLTDAEVAANKAKDKAKSAADGRRPGSDGRGRDVNRGDHRRSRSRDRERRR